MNTVSVIIPCYNQVHHLPEALDSVLGQTRTDRECLIVNDGSPDKTAEIVERYVQRDKRIRHIAQNNRGLSGARNRGWDEAAEQRIQFLDSDDLIFPDKLSRQRTALSSTSAPALSYCHHYYCSGLVHKTAHPRRGHGLKGHIKHMVERTTIVFWRWYWADLRSRPLQRYGHSGASDEGE